MSPSGGATTTCGGRLSNEAERYEGLVDEIKKMRELEAKQAREETERAEQEEQHAEQEKLRAEQ